MKRTFLFIVSVFLIALTVSSCGGFSVSPVTPTPFGRYEIDPIFWGFFHKIGGTEQFGRVVSTVFTNVSRERLQFTETVLLVYDPVESRYFLAPLGVDLNLGEPPDKSQTQAGDLVINGYRIHPALVNLYQELGREVVGAPISNPKYNYAKNRLEQHFENLGMYYLLDDNQKIPRLLSYGLLACPTCPDGGGGGTVVPLISDKEFRIFLESQGCSKDMVGDIFWGPDLLNDGTTTAIVYEHMILRSKDGSISIMPLAQELGLGGNELFAPIDSPMLTFIPVKNGMGHNVLNEFDSFIEDHGGYMVTGDPISELFTPDLETNIIRQCFSNLCLDYYPDALEAPVRPALLGREYKNKHPELFPQKLEGAAVQPNLTTRNPSLFVIRVSEYKSSINSFTPQTITAQVFSYNVAQPRQILNLYLVLPDGAEQLYTMPATNQNGITGLTIPPIQGKNGTMIEYKVCLEIQNQEAICAKDSFMIWGNP
jgi:hypothetical protein